MIFNFKNLIYLFYPKRCPFCNKIIDKNCLFIVPLFDISLFVKELKGYNALHSRNMNSIGVLEIQPITKLKPSIDNISITVYNSTTNFVILH